MRELRGCEKPQKAALAVVPQKDAPKKPADDVESPAEVPAGRPSLEELKGWKVLTLRSYVRRLPGFPLSPGEIRYANKAGLIEALTAYYETH